MDPLNLNSHCAKNKSFLYLFLCNSLNSGQRSGNGKGREVCGRFWKKEKWFARKVSNNLKRTSLSSLVWGFSFLAFSLLLRRRRRVLFSTQCVFISCCCCFSYGFFLFFFSTSCFCQPFIRSLPVSIRSQTLQFRAGSAICCRVERDLIFVFISLSYHISFSFSAFFNICFSSR